MLAKWLPFLESQFSHQRREGGSIYPKYLPEWWRRSDKMLAVKHHTDKRQKILLLWKIKMFGETERMRGRFTKALNILSFWIELGFLPWWDAKVISPLEAPCSFWPISLILYIDKRSCCCFSPEMNRVKSTEGLLSSLWLHCLQTTIFNQQKKRPSESQS